MSFGSGGWLALVAATAVALSLFGCSNPRGVSAVQAGSLISPADQMRLNSPSSWYDIDPVERF